MIWTPRPTVNRADRQRANARPRHYIRKVKSHIWLCTGAGRTTEGVTPHKAFLKWKAAEK